MRRASRDPEPRLLFPQPVSVGGARSSGWWWPEPGGGWVSRTRRAASAWPGLPEPVAPSNPKLGESRGAADVGRVQPRAPLSRRGAPLPRPGLRAGPGGSGPPARRGPWRDGGRAHLPPGKLSRDFSKLPLAEDLLPWLPPLLAFHSPPPPIVPTHGGPGPGRRRGLLQTWSCHSLPFLPRAYFSVAKKKSRGERIVGRVEAGSGRDFKVEGSSFET